MTALAQQRTARQQAQWNALQTGAGRTDTQGGPAWNGGTPAGSTSTSESPRTGWWPALTGATTGVGQSLAHMAQGAAQTGADSLEQLGDILTFGANHDHPQMQEVWERQRARGQALVRVASDPTGTATDMMESVAQRYAAAIAITDNDYERSRQLGYLFNDVGQGLLGAGTVLRGAPRLGATGGEMLGENAFTGPLAGGRAAQRGGVEVGANGGVAVVEGAIPNAANAVIDPGKLTSYALNPAHPVGGNKAIVFDSALGYNAANADQLIAQIQQGVRTNPAVLGKVDQFGQRFTVDMPITGPNGNTATVRTGWIIDPGTATPRLTTTYVK